MGTEMGRRKVREGKKRKVREEKDRKAIARREKTKEEENREREGE